MRPDHSKDCWGYLWCSAGRGSRAARALLAATILTASTYSSGCARFVTGQDRKSTRLNSSHRTSSYAVFCLKKKKRTGRRDERSALVLDWRGGVTETRY